MTARLALVAVLSVVVGCGTVAGPSAGAPTGDQRPVVYRFPIGEVPEAIRVHAPKDARGLDHCALLSSADVAALGLDPASARPQITSDPDLAGCDWNPVGRPDELAGFGTRVETENPALRGVYIRSERIATLFEPTEVAGHPAVIVRRTPTAGCTIEVGVADDQLLSASTTVLKDDCAWARRMAAAVLAHLPPRTR